jgi:ketol-acid reductoisomerase
MRYSVSDTAEYGDYIAGPRLVDDRVRATMKALLTDIQDGTFAKNWVAENEAGQPWFQEERKRQRHHLIEEVGGKLRRGMSFLDPVEMPEDAPGGGR